MAAFLARTIRTLFLAPQRQQIQTGTAWINSQQRTGFQFRFHLPQRGGDLYSNGIRTDIVCPDLDHTRFLAVCHRENRTEVQIVCERCNYS